MFAPSPCLPSWPVPSNPIIKSRSPSIDAPSPQLPQLTFPLALHDDIPDAPSPQLLCWQPTDAQQPSPDERSPDAPSPLLLSMANLDMTVHDIPLPFCQYKYTGSLEMLVFPNPGKSILQLCEDVTFATRTCALACCKPVITAEAPDMSSHEA